jgi:hypothetical protein
MEYLYPKNSGNTVHCRVLAAYPWEHMTNWKLLQFQHIMLHIDSPGTFKIESMVSTECILLSHCSKDEKLSQTTIRWGTMCTVYVYTYMHIYRYLYISVIFFFCLFFFQGIFKVFEFVTPTLLI